MKIPDNTIAKLEKLSRDFANNLTIERTIRALWQIAFLFLFPLNGLCFILFILVVAGVLCGAMTPAEIAIYGGGSVAGILLFSAFVYFTKKYLD